VITFNVKAKVGVARIGARVILMAGMTDWSLRPVDAGTVARGISRVLDGDAEKVALNREGVAVMTVERYDPGVKIRQGGKSHVLHADVARHTADKLIQAANEN
jgi:hypothetical protein